MPPPRLRKFAFLALFLPIFFSCGVFGQSLCTFMKETDLDVWSVPEEPVRLYNLSVCHVHRATCCTPDLESQMQLSSRLGIERSVQDQLILLRQQLDHFGTVFRGHFRHSLNETRAKLHRMFERSYGPFYLQNRQIFDDFFDELDAFFVADYPNSNVKQILVRLFRKMFVRIFELLNPLRRVGEIEKECMMRIQDDLRPFGGLPHKIALLVERAFVAWKAILRTLDRTNDTLYRLLDVSVSLNCSRTTARMQQCHVCSGASPKAKPCAGFCMNVLKGCFAELAEVDPQWNFLIDSFVRFADRLRGPYNPDQVLAPLAVQISEAIMHFQEKGNQLSNRIAMQCFSNQIDFSRFRRAISENEISLKSFESRLAVDSEEEEEDDDDETHPAPPNPVRDSVNLFVDRLLRTKSFFRSLPQAICTEKRLVAPRGESCWNGYSMGRYTRRVVGDGVASQKRNPEFQGQTLWSRETHLDERIQLAVLANNLDSLFQGRPAHSESTYDGSGLPTLSESIVDGSGLPVDDEDDFNDISLEGLPDSDDPRDRESVAGKDSLGSSVPRIPPCLGLWLLAWLCLSVRP